MAPKLFNKVWGEAGKLGLAERWVLGYMAWRADKNGLAWPAMPTIKHDTGMSLSSVRAILRRLEAKGYIRATIGVGRGNPNVYAVFIPPLRARPGSDEFDADAASASDRRSSIEKPELDDLKTRSLAAGFSSGKPPANDIKNRQPVTPNPPADALKTAKSHARSRSQIQLNTYKNNRNTDSDSVSSLSSFSSQVDRERLKPENLPFIRAGGEGGGEGGEPRELPKCRWITCTSPVVDSSTRDALYCAEHGTFHSGYRVRKKEKE